MRASSVGKPPLISSYFKTYLWLQIGKKSCVDLIEKIWAFAITNPAVQLAEGDDTMEVEEEMTLCSPLLCFPLHHPQSPHYHLSHIHHLSIPSPHPPFLLYSRRSPPPARAT